MAPTPPLSFVVPETSSGARAGGLFDGLLSLIGLDRHSRAYGRALFGNDRFSFAGIDLEAENAAAWEFYRNRLRREGLDPHAYDANIQWAVQHDYNWSFGLGVFDPALLSRPEPVRREPRIGSREARRAEAKRTFHASGVYGLPSAGGHILNEDERRFYGVEIID